MKLSFRKLYSESRVDEACKREMYKTGDDECENKFWKLFGDKYGVI